VANLLLTPKQVARSIGVSESSLKRWCDRGTIATVKTAGGHRRIQIADVLKFLRETGRQPVAPEMLGLPAVIGAGERTWQRSRDRFLTALISGDESVARQIIYDLYVAGHPVCLLADWLFHPTLQEIGRRWNCGKAEVYQERRACEICNRVLFELRASLPALRDDAPLALGGTPVGDHYRLPTILAELVLREAGCRAISLGSDLPFETFRAAIAEHRPRLFWLSVSHLDDPDSFVRDYTAFYESLSPRPAVVLGGRALNDDIRRQLTYAAHCDNMRQLAALVDTMGFSPQATALGAAMQRDEEVA
jgi:MerR family transcriptional regulator, light-induced transcriptional regulator